jgi:hypothetical protein
MTHDISRETIEEWLGSWNINNNVGHLAKDTDDSTSRNYAQVIPWPEGKDPYQGWVHYEVIKRSDQWFAEFHVELYKSQGREGLENKLNSTLWKNGVLLRGILRDSFSANRYWKCRCPIQTEDDLKNDLNLLKRLVDESKIMINTNSDGKFPVAIKTSPLIDVLKHNLQVPKYQRAYCWRMEDVRRMMNDIYVWQQKHASGNYNIGTIVLKKLGEGIEKYAIIDGQQRLTTFALFAHLLKDKLGDVVLGKFDLGENNKRSESIGFLVRARNVLKTLIDKGKHIQLERVSINVVLLSNKEDNNKEDDDLAYLFFNHTNSLGRKLTDYELLKGHHLRFVDTTSESVDCGVAAYKTVEIWNRLRQPLEVFTPNTAQGQTVLKNGEEEVLHKILFRLREWGAGESFSPWADDLPTHDLFHHFSTDDEPFEGVISAGRTVDYDSIVRDGPEFFNYAEAYRWKFASYLQTLPVGLLYAHLRGHSNDVLFDIINALGFLFYDRFGEKYLPEALFCITYRVSEIRNKGKVMQKYVGSIDIPGISKWAMPTFLSSTINRSNHESVLFPILIDPACDYELPQLTPAMQSYWTSVKSLLETLSKTMELTAVKERAEVIKRQIEVAVKNSREVR